MKFDYFISHFNLPFRRKRHLSLVANLYRPSLLVMLAPYKDIVGGRQRIFQCATIVQIGSWLRSWLTHCATSRKVAGSIPDGVIDINLPAAL
jgi:hypothetical protein